MLEDKKVASFVTELLQELDQSVRWEGDVHSALNVLRRENGAYDLVFSNVEKPGMAGVELAQTIRVEWPTLEIIFTSGYSHVLAYEGTHGFELLKKPYSIEGLLTALRRKYSWEAGEIILDGCAAAISAGHAAQRTVT